MMELIGRKLLTLLCTAEDIHQLLPIGSLKIHILLEALPTKVVPSLRLYGGHTSDPRQWRELVASNETGAMRQENASLKSYGSRRMLIVYSSSANKKENGPLRHKFQERSHATQRTS
jgi:hypothetical protein